MPETARQETHTISVLVDNEPGVLARVIGLFSGRGYNIESLTVAETDPQGNLSRITIVTSGTPMVIEQIKNQLGRLVPVHKVSDLTIEGPHVEREMALVKVRGRARSGWRRCASPTSSAPASSNSTNESFVFEIIGKTTKLNAFIGLMQSAGAGRRGPHRRRRHRPRTGGVLRESGRDWAKDAPSPRPSPARGEGGRPPTSPLAGEVRAMRAGEGAVAQSR